LFDLEPKFFWLRVQPDPFTLAGVKVEVTHGATIREALKQVGACDEKLFAVFIGGELIPPHAWDRVRPNAGVTVEVRGVPGVEGLTLAATQIFNLGVTGMLWASAIATVVVGAAIYAALAFSVNSLFGKRGGAERGARDRWSEDRNYGINAGSNELRPYGAIPIVLGTHRMFPPYAASPYTEVVANDQYLRMAFLWGYGPVQLENLRIGSTPIEEFTGVEQEHDETGELDTLTLYPGQVQQESLADELTTSFVTRTTDIEADDIGITLTFPNGLHTRDQSLGNVAPWTVTIRAHYRRAGPSMIPVPEVEYLQAADVSVVGDATTLETTYGPHNVLRVGSSSGTNWNRVQVSGQDTYLAGVKYTVAVVVAPGTGGGVNIEVYGNGGSNYWSVRGNLGSISIASAGSQIGCTVHRVSESDLDGEGFRTIEIDFTMDADVTSEIGVGPNASSVGHNVYLREVVAWETDSTDPAGPWTLWIAEEIRRTTTRTVRVAWRTSGLAPAHYDIRVRRTTTARAGTFVIDDCNWTAMRIYRGEDPILEPDVAKSVLRIKANDQLNGVVDQFSAVVSSLIPTWDGAEWGGTNKTSNPAALYRHVLTCSANAEAISTDLIADEDLGAWYEYCEAQGYTYNRVIEAFQDTGDLLMEIAAAGFASPQILGSSWSAVIDKSRSTVTQLFTPRNSWEFSGQVITSDIPHALRVIFANEERDYKEDERVVYDDGYDATNATDYRMASFEGCTHPDNAYRLARHMLATLRLRPERFSFKCDVENLVARRGDLVRIQHDAALIGQAAARIKSIDGSDLTLDELVTFEAGKTYGLRARKAGGNVVLLTATYSSVTGTTATLTVDDATGLAVGDLCVFGETGAETVQGIIDTIEFEDDLVAHITCMPYVEDVYSAADTIPPYNSVISDPVSLSTAGPAAPVINQLRSDEDVLVTTASGEMQAAIVVDFESGDAGATNNPYIRPTDHFRLRYRPSEGLDPWTYVTLDGDARTVTLTPVDSNVSYDVGLQAVDSLGGVSAWISENGHVVIGFSTPPPQVDTFTMDVIGDVAYAKWTYPSIAPDVVGFEIRYHADTDVTTWAYMSVLSDQIDRGTRQFMVPSRRGSYAIKAIDYAGNKSELALFINSSITDPQQQNEVTTTAEHPDFTGTKTDVAVVDGQLQLVGDTVMADWDTLAGLESMTRATSSNGVELEGIYEFGEVDLGAVYTTRFEAALDIRSVNFRDTMAAWVNLSSLANMAGGETGDEYSVDVQIAWSADDNESPTYGAWQTFAVIDVTARWVRFRAVLTTTDNQITPTISALTITGLLPDRVVSGSDVQSGATTKSVSISPAFETLKTVTARGENMEAGDYFVITNKTRSGFEITFYNSSDVTIDRQFDWQATGQGQEAP
jgi:hypothetical protein